MSSAWIAGKHGTIDESIIKYMGCAISFVQYMPAKPIKHGMKVFALCCAMSTVLLGLLYITEKRKKQMVVLSISVTDWFLR